MKATQTKTVEISRLEIERFVLGIALHKYGVKAELKDIQFSLEGTHDSTLSRLKNEEAGATITVHLPLEQVPEGPKAT